MADPALPLTIQVGPFTYTVSNDELEVLRQCQRSSTALLGHTDQRQQRILLHPDQALGCMQDTLLHETMHVVAWTSGLSDEWGHEREEAVVQRLTPLLLGVLRDNPQLVKYLTG